MRFLCALALILLLLASLSVPDARADVVVLANYSPAVVDLTIVPRQGPSQPFRVATGDSLVVPTIGSTSVTFRSQGKLVRFRLHPNRAYRFDQPEGQPLMMRRIGLGGDAATEQGTGIAKAEGHDLIGMIPVKILVDEEERAARAVWEPRLRRRLDAASDILEKSCRLRLRVVAAGEWQSDNRITDVEKSLEELENEVEAAPARLVIGFSSQYGIPPQPAKLGMTRRPFHTHILVPERSRDFTEAERLEILLQQLGRYLGALPSGDAESVMRPLLGDGKARNARFRIGFDPANLLAINLLAEEYRFGDVTTLAGLSSATKKRLRQVHGIRAQKLAEKRVAEPPPESETVTETPGETETPEAKPAATPAQQRLQGTWITVSAKRGGTDSKTPVGYTQTFSGDHVTVRTGENEKIRFRYKLGPTGGGTAGAPFDLILEFAGKTLVSKGIYRIDGDKLTTCQAEPGKPRPTRFDSKSEEGHATLVFRRVKQTVEMPAEEKEAGKQEGPKQKAQEQKPE